MAKVWHVQWWWCSTRSNEQPRGNGAAWWRGATRACRGERLMGANEKREGGDGGTGCVRARQRRARAAQGQQRQEHDAASQPIERARECVSESSRSEGQRESNERNTQPPAAKRRQVRGRANVSSTWRLLLAGAMLARFLFCLSLDRHSLVVVSYRCCCCFAPPLFVCHAARLVFYHRVRHPITACSGSRDQIQQGD